MMNKVTIVGSGNWGSVAAKLVATNTLNLRSFHDEVRMWVFEETLPSGQKLSDVINETNENVKYLPGVKLGKNVVADPDLENAVKGANMLVFVSPHQFMEGVCKRVAGKIRRDAEGISLVKGMEVKKEGPSMISTLISNTLGINCSVLMGANIANEIALENFSEATVGYSQNKEAAMRWVQLFNTPYFNVTAVQDVEGVEMCGTLKNIVAVAAGLVDGLEMGNNTKKLINSRGPIEDPSPVACASRSLITGHADGLLSYKTTSNLISSSSCCFSDWDIDSHLLGLLKLMDINESPVYVLLNPSINHSQKDLPVSIFESELHVIDGIPQLIFVRSSYTIETVEAERILVDHVAHLKPSDGGSAATQLAAHLTGIHSAIKMLHSRIKVLHHYLLAMEKVEIGMIIGTHLKMVNAIDCLLSTNPQSEEFLWVVWELSALSRSACGRQALLALGNFPEAVSILIEALSSTKESESVGKNSGSSPVNLTIFHSVAEIIEAIVTDSTSSSLGSWIYG